MLLANSSVLSAIFFAVFGSDLQALKILLIATSSGSSSKIDFDIFPARLKKQETRPVGDIISNYEEVKWTLKDMNLL